MSIDDTLVLTEGATGALIATDRVTSGSTTSHYQYVKVAFGADGSATATSTSSGAHLPVQLYHTGTAIGRNSDAIKAHIASSGITLNVITQGGTLDAIFVQGATVESATVIGGTLDSVTIVGGTIDNVAAATIIGGTLDSVTMAGGTIDNVVSATVSGGTLDAVFVQGATATIIGGTLDAVFVQGATVNSVEAATVIGGTLDAVFVQGATITSIGISGGTVGYTGGIGDQDSIIVQGVTGAFPVGTLVHGLCSGGPNGAGYRGIGASGDALKVAVVGAAISATISDTNITIAGGTLTVGGGTIDNVVSAGVTSTDGGAIFIQPKTGITFDVGGSKLSGIDNAVTVTATDLDIRGLTMGEVGLTGGHPATDDSVLIQGVTGGYPVGNILYGISSGSLGVPIALEVDFLNNTPTLKTVLDGRGQTNATALQVQGRFDGLTLNPVIVGGDGPTSDVSPTTGLIGVTFDAGANGFLIKGGATAPIGSDVQSVATLLHGISGNSIVPIGVCLDAGGDYAIKTHLANAEGVTFDVTVASSVTIGNTLSNGIPIMGACASPQNYGVFVTGTAGSPNQWPIMVQGYNAAGSSSTDEVHPIGVTLEHFNAEIVGVSGGIAKILEGVSGSSLSLGNIDSTLNTISNSIGTNTSPTVQDSTEKAAQTLGNLGTNASIVDVLNNITALPTEVPTKRAFVNVPAPSSFVSQRLSATATAAPFAAADLSSGARVKLHPEATGIVFVGKTGVNSSNWYPLSAGEDVFIEIDDAAQISVIADASGGSNLDVFLIGF